jgi:hypothetical protein
MADKAPAFIEATPAAVGISRTRPGHHKPGRCQASEVIDLMREIQTAVRRVFGVDLQPEPYFVGFPDSSRHPAI